MGVKFSKQFALNKQAQKVKMVATDTAISNDDDPDDGETTGGNFGGGGETPTGDLEG